MKVLITGASGLLGHDVWKLFERGHDLKALGRSQPRWVDSARYSECDLTNAAHTYAVVTKENPEVIVHCAAFNNVDGAEGNPEQAYRGNALATRNLALACQRFDATLISISTDYVFDGTDALPSGYREFDPCRPVNRYGESKRWAEIYIEQLLTKFFIVRTSWLFGPGRATWVDQVADRARQDQSVQAASDMVSAPTYTPDLAAALLRLAESRHYGTYHLTNEGFCSRVELAEEVLKVQKLGGYKQLEKKELSELKLIARRPAFSGLDNLAWKLDGFPPLRSWKEALREHFANKKVASFSMTLILGISAFYHDSAACLLKDGAILFAAQEERFTRIKHDRNFPLNAIAAALQATGKRIQDIDHVAYYDKPLLTFDRLFETWVAFAPRGWSSFLAALPVWLHEKLNLSKEIDKGLQNVYEGPLYFTLHHQSHAASAFFPSPFPEAAVLTMDGVGEWSTTTLGQGSGNHLELLQEIRFPHSLGLLYSAFTYYTGFKVNSGEYKVMGLAPYGTPRFADLIRKHLIDLKPDGSFWMDMRYFNYCQGLTMTSEAFHDLFGGPPRKPESRLTERDMDLAASVQKVCEDVMLSLARQAKKVTGADYLTMAGGCALNCVANGLILKEKIFKKIFVQPAAGDAGGSLGAALMLWHHVLENPRSPLPTDSQKGSYLGTSFEDAAVEAALRPLNAKYRRYNPQDLAPAVAELLEQGKVVGLFYGPMEFGPRALGARSIIGDPRKPDMQSVMNVKVKFRESFRPFAPAVLAERCADYFDLEDESPYMLMVGPVKAAHRKSLTEEQKQKKGIDLLNTLRSDIPAVTHVDWSARVQTLTRERNGMFYDIVKAFDAKTGCPVIINTSFNIRGEPIVNTPAEAYRCFMLTDMDALVLQNAILLKEEQPLMPGAEEYKRQFKLD